MITIAVIRNPTILNSSVFVPRELARRKLDRCPVAHPGVFRNLPTSLALAIEEYGRMYEGWTARFAVIRVCYICRHMHGETDGSRAEDSW